MSVSGEIGRLAQLRDQGIVTEDEFQRQKDILLSHQKNKGTPIAKGLKSVGIGCLVLLGLIMMPAIIGAIRGTSSDTSGDRAESMAEGPGVLRSDYDRLKVGMTYQQAVTILGQAGRELSRNEAAGTVTVTYRWRGLGLGSMNATFQDDRLVQKTQFDL